LILNDSAKFEDRWTYLKNPDSGIQNPSQQKCIWTVDIPGIIYLPVAHGEGKFYVDDPAILNKLKSNNQIVFQYCNLEGALTGYPDNPNGSQDNIAGICDDSGRVLGLMPHPERHLSFLQHPHWTRLPEKEAGDGILIFKNGVEYAKKNLCR